MASFYDAYKHTIAYEGGYVCDADDVGGETYMGIARQYHPGWHGWKIIDSAKDQPDFPECLTQKISLRESVKSFFKMHYWDRFQGDKMPDQIIAEELFDTGVNLGIKQAVKYLQTALNVLNRNGSLYPDIIIDGIYGSRTSRALNAYLRNDNHEIILKIMNILQGTHYINYMRRSPVQEKFARSWLKRVAPKKARAN